MQMAIDKAILEGVCEITKLVVISENNSDKDDMRVEKLKVRHYSEYLLIYVLCCHNGLCT